MKARLTFSSERPVSISIAYNYYVQSMIYDLIKRRYPDLHDEGFVYENRHFKLFSFSRLFSQKFEVHNKMINFQSPIYLFFSSPITELVEVMVNSALQRSKVRIGSNELILTEVSAIDEEISGSTVDVKTFSPITVYSTFSNGQTHYYSPNEQEFASFIKLNLSKKANILNLETEDDFSIEPLDFNERNSTVTFYKNFMVKGWNGKFRLTGGKKMLELALSAGLGAKNSQGFGLTVLEEVKMWDS